MSLPETTSLLLEIGCEEIPARFLRDAQKCLGDALEIGLGALRLLRPRYPSLQTYSTPRRLVVWVPEVLRQELDRVEQAVGPPVKAAFDAAGKPTKAAEGFAQKHGTTVEKLIRVATPKGEYLSATLTLVGRPAEKVLPELLLDVVEDTGCRFVKSMYWLEKSGPRFVRPIRWLLALLGEGTDARVIPFEIAGVRSGDVTYGHRSAGVKAIRVRSFKEYAKKLRTKHVEIDPAKRREKVRHELQVLLKEFRKEIISQSNWKGGDFSLQVIDDPSLEEWVVNSTEWLTAILGSFDMLFQDLPREILVTVMRDHQKYFAVENEHGVLQSRFVTMLNRDGDPKGLIRQGHERVLQARFTDALFFWNADQKIPLAGRIPMLERVTYHEKLGTYADKVRRMKALAETICTELEHSGSMNAAERGYALRAVELCKCDLTTQMVQEFTELEGVIGGLYAGTQGEPAEVADAIYGHYRPAGLEDACPCSIAGAVVSLADKFDSVVAGFSAGLEPTGSSDPFGLRRAGNGIVKVAVEVLPGLNLQNLLRVVLALDLGLPAWKSVEDKISAFYRERLEFYLASVMRTKYDTVRAVVNSWWGWAVPSQAVERARALEAVRLSADFEALSIAAKRTRNILHKPAELSDYGPSNSVQPELVEGGPERDLYEAYLEMRERLARYESDGDYVGAFRALAALRPKVDAFFDKVLVMDPDKKVRANRLRLLSELNGLIFLRLADLSEIGLASADSGAVKASGQE